MKVRFRIRILSLHRIRSCLSRIFSKPEFCCRVWLTCKTFVNFFCNPYPLIVEKSSFSVICFVVCILIVSCYMSRKCDPFSYGRFKEFRFFPMFGSFTTGYCAIESTTENNMMRRIFLQNQVYFRRLRAKKTKTFPPLDGLPRVALHPKSKSTRGAYS